MDELKNSEAIREALQHHIDTNCVREGETNNPRMKWDGELLELRNLFIIALIREGHSRVRCNQIVKEMFGVSKATADSYYKTALEYLVVENEGIKGAARKVAIERLNGVIEDAKRRGANHTALQAMEQLNKINGLYSEKKEIEVTGLKFDFGGE